MFPEIVSNYWIGNVIWRFSIHGGLYHGFNTYCGLCYQVFLLCLLERNPWLWIIAILITENDVFLRNYDVFLRNFDAFGINFGNFLHALCNYVLRTNFFYMKLFVLWIFWNYDCCIFSWIMRRFETIKKCCIAIIVHIYPWILGKVGNFDIW